VKDVAISDSHLCQDGGKQAGSTSECDTCAVDNTRLPEPTSTPSRSGGEIEAALQELRSMFPGEPISIEFHDYSGMEGCAGNGYVTVTSETHQSTEASLDEAMAAVRKWKQENE